MLQLPAVTFARSDAGAPAKPHAAHAVVHAGAPSVLLTNQTRLEKAGTTKASFSRLVLGYFPYWADSVGQIPWQHLTHLIYFSAEMNADGSLGDSHGWAEAGAGLVQTAHENGVEVVLCATLFDDDAIASVLLDEQNRERAVAGLLELVQSQGADGVNIDFESVPKRAKEAFVQFMRELREAFHGAIDGAHVSLASPAVDANGSYDYDQLARHSDALLIMGYEYHWAGGNPGPVSPISSGDEWSVPDLRWTIEDYLEWGGEQNRDRFVLGLPLYGRDWPTQDDRVPGSALDRGVARTFDACEDSFALGKSWDEVSETPYRVYQQNDWHQLFCEDTRSLAAKLDLASEYDLAGVMFWALSYAAPDHLLWEEVDSRWEREPQQNQPPLAAVRAVDRSRVGQEVTLDGTPSSDPDDDLITYRWRAVLGPPVVIRGEDRPLATFQPSAVGDYLFELRVDDGLASDAAEVAIEVLEDERETDSEAGCRATSGVGYPVTSSLALLLLALRRTRRKARMIGEPPPVCNNRKRVLSL